MFRPQEQQTQEAAAVLSRTTSEVGTVSIRRRPSSIAADEGDDRPLAEGVEVLADRGERRPVVRGIRNVVEADHADVLRHTAARFGQRADHTERHLVVGREHGRDGGIGRERAG